MSFAVFASGSGGFRYQEDHFFDGDGFSTLQVLNTLLSMEPTKLGAVDAVRDHFLNADMADGLPVIAQREYLHSLSTTIDLLNVRTGTGTDAFIGLTVKKMRPLWPDLIRVSRYNFNPGDSPSVEFFRLISRNLEDTSLKTWGVLMALTLALSKFLDHLNKRDDPSLPTMINIFLTH